jgi:hypothetical protein
MTDQFVRSGPENSRALWHMVNPESAGGLTYCSRSPSGPTTDSADEVLASPWSWCPKCTERRWARIDQAVTVLRTLAPELLIQSEREAK